METCLSSNHLPITPCLSSLIQKVYTPKRTFINLEKAERTFTAMTEDLFVNVTNNVHKSEMTFRKIIQKADKMHILAGRIPKVCNAGPTTTANLMEERDQIRSEEATLLTPGLST